MWSVFFKTLFVFSERFGDKSKQKVLHYNLWIYIKINKQKLYSKVNIWFIVSLCVMCCLYVYQDPSELWVPNKVQWNPSCGATPFASEKCPFKRGGLSSGWPLKRCSTVYVLISIWLWDPIGLYICMSDFLTVEEEIFHKWWDNQSKKMANLSRIDLFLWESGAEIMSK